MYIEPYKVLVATFTIDGFSLRKIWYNKNTEKYTVTSKDGTSINNEKQTFQEFDDIESISSSYFISGYDIQLEVCNSHIKKPMLKASFG